MDKAQADELARQLRRGDETAFDSLVRMFERPVFNLAFRMLNSHEDASDATQEIFVKIYRSIGSFRGTSSFSTWLYAVAANACRSRIRSTRRRSELEVRMADLYPDDGEDHPEPVAVENEQRPDKVAERAETRKQIEMVIARLPPDYSTVVIMRDVQDMQYEEIAGALGCSLGTVKSRLARGRAMVKQKLMRMCPGLLESRMQS